MLPDLRLALRTFIQKPGFALIAVLTMALGIGATTAIFSVADAILWKSLPMPDPGRLVMVLERRVEEHGGWDPCLSRELCRLEAEQSVLSAPRRLPVFDRQPCRR